MAYMLGLQIPGVELPKMPYPTSATSTADMSNTEYDLGSSSSGTQQSRVYPQAQLPMPMPAPMGSLPDPIDSSTLDWHQVLKAQFESFYGYDFQSFTDPEH